MEDPGGKLTEAIEQLFAGQPPPWGLVIVDHGSRRDESNKMLCEFVRRYGDYSGTTVVEPAHMELAEPSIATAFDRCVARGARLVIVFPFFLLPGRHWTQDIPRLVAAAAKQHPGVNYLVTAPFALHPLMMDAVADRVTHCLRRACQQGPTCDVCSEAEGCRLAAGADAPQEA